ncbi:MAG: deaminase [Candidatus Zhuqueibacterota bacterium]
MLIGLTGTNASGKSSIVTYLASKRFEPFSLSDIIRDELAANNLPLSRELLIRKGNELRSAFGPAILAERIIGKLKSPRAIIDSIRNPSEVRALRRLDNFFLIAVDAPVALRFERAQQRGRIESSASLESFIALENQEKSSDANFQNIAACMDLAEFRIVNDGSVAELHRKVDHISTQLEKRIRISWDDYFMKMAFLVAERSTCLRHHVGAIIVKNRHVVTTGYNGAARKTNDCLKLGCLRNKLNIPSGERHEICRAIHAEQNAIIQAGVHGVTIKGGTLYCTHSPCIICAKMIVNSGIRKVVTCGDYPDNFNMVVQLFDEAGVTLMKMSLPTTEIEIKL